ncbi:hypothetical protein PJ985_11840 [Streptomyces sp. ACA25]|uniref:hypothetical protein n=1 Tax=Streptomyces sp. ACA25 TaxID=3022596 RepID=UPI002307F129|nr:hypothetical protein [Streptomyces sp. ACA25]MDB1088255.1 hypothetical protein [Streptomyces sp. ACA25]
MGKAHDPLVRHTEECGYPDPSVDVLAGPPARTLPDPAHREGTGVLPVMRSRVPALFAPAGTGGS